METAIFTFCLVCATQLGAQTKDGIYELDKECAISQTGTIKLNSSDAKVTVTGSSRSTAHVKIFRQVTNKGIVFGSEEFGIDVSEDNGNLQIRERSRSTVVGMVGYSYEKYTIDLEVPIGVSLHVRGDDGDYMIKNIGGSISLDLDDADVELFGCTGDDFRFRLDDGDILMDQGRGSLDVDADDADVKISNANFTSVVARVDDGDFTLETSLANGGDYQITAQDGMVALTITGGGGKFGIRHGDSRVTTAGDFQQESRSENRTSLVLASGNAQVDIRVDDARVRLVKR